ncbi:MAG: precorrin-6y C5,15-methyltransferase (decarboxylating) subunit CbiE [Nitrospinae bacterium]|nr:precorrin-6y C5,15-methyltransferase (decarboxylating) subunit CbiE [Nitrospinota bacterium]
MITIIGCGPGSAEYLTQSARQAAGEADFMIGSKRLLELFPATSCEKIAEGADTTKVIMEIEARLGKGKIAVLVSGDPGLYSLARPVIRRFGAAKCRVIPGVSSIQLAFARLGLEWNDAKIISAHAGDPTMGFDALRAESKIAVLGGRKESSAWVRKLAESLGDNRAIFALENLSLPDEKVEEVKPWDIDGREYASMTIFLIIRRDLLK